MMYDKLLEYKMEHLREAPCDEKLLLLVQREVQQIMNLERMKGESFDWPKSYRSICEGERGTGHWRCDPPLKT